LTSQPSDKQVFKKDSAPCSYMGILRIYKLDYEIMDLKLAVLHLSHQTEKNTQKEPQFINWFLQHLSTNFCLCELWIISEGKVKICLGFVFEVVLYDASDTSGFR